MRWVRRLLCLVKCLAYLTPPVHLAGGSMGENSKETTPLGCWGGGSYFPPVTRKPLEFPSHCSESLKAFVLQEEVDKMILKDAQKIVSDREPFF